MELPIVVRGLAAFLLAAAGAVAMAQSVDVDEPNDTPDQATAVGPVGFVRTGRVLRVADEDWYRFTVVKGGSPVTVEVAYDTSAYDTTLTLSVQTLDGAGLATGEFDGASGSYRAVTGPLDAGDYLVSVRHSDGGDLLDYSVRASAADDADEPNGVPDEATALGPVGFVRTARVLNFGDEDWYRFDVPSSGGAVTVDVAYDTSAYHPAVTLEVQTLTGDVLATGALANTSGPFRAVTGPLDAGAYLVHLRHDGGDAISDYTLQAYTALAMSAPTHTESTAGAALDIAVDIRGGIQPYTLGVDSRFAVPPGLVFDGVAGRITGLPAVAGRYDFMLTCRDAGSPANTISVAMTLVVNDRLDLRLGEFTAFALGKSASRAIPADGGTAPFAITTTLGGLPSGISFVAGALAFDGASDGASADSASVPLAFDVTDASGRSDSATTTCVVCRPLGSFGLADGRAASGVYFDAVQGSAVSINVATAKHQSRRTLRVVLLGPDGTTPLPAKVAIAKGKAALSHFVAPATGRYYLVVASDSGPAAELVAGGKVTPPARGVARADAFHAQDRLEISFGAIEGAVVTFTATPDKSGLQLAVQSLADPTGALVPILPVRKGGAVSFTTVLGRSGTWTVVVVGSRGGPGKVSCTYKLGQPKGARYSADD